jgi:threonine aldolase
MIVNASDTRACPSPDTLKALASANTGLDDFGDPGRDEGLEALVRSINEETWA